MSLPRRSVPRVVVRFVRRESGPPRGVGHRLEECGGRGGEADGRSRERRRRLLPALVVAHAQHHGGVAVPFGDGARDVPRGLAIRLRHGVEAPEEGRLRLAERGHLLGEDRERLLRTRAVAAQHDVRRPLLPERVDGASEAPRVAHSCVAQRRRVVAHQRHVRLLRVPEHHQPHLRLPRLPVPPFRRAPPPPRAAPRLFLPRPARAVRAGGAQVRVPGWHVSARPRHGTACAAADDERGARMFAPTPRAAWGRGGAERRGGFLGFWVHGCYEYVRRMRVPGGARGE